MKIFWDIDETLIHTRTFKSSFYEENFKFRLMGQTYYTCVRPCSKGLIEFSRQLVGRDNIYILTAATARYAQHINEKAGWGFAKNHILTRETMERYSTKVVAMYGNSFTDVSPHPLADIDNVLIDNLPPRDNREKIALLGFINPDKNYYEVTDYYGDDSTEVQFEADVKNFLLNYVKKKEP